MGKAHESGRERLEAEAAAWLARLETGAADIDEFERWRAASTAHAAAFAQLDAAWMRMNRARALRPPGAPNPDLFADADEQAQSRRWLLRAAVLGGLAVLGAGAAGVLMSGRAYAATSVGERRTVRLPDGSLIELNTDSRASWRFGESSRRVWLDRGEAAIEVARDAQTRPFIIGADDSAVVELNQGVFNARLESAGMDVTVLSGQAVASGAAAPAGCAVFVGAQGAEVRQLTAAATDAAAAWRRGEIIFDGDTLGVAVAEYNRYLTAKIEITDPEIAQLRLGGRFTTHDPTAFLNSIEQAFGVRVERAADGSVTLTGG